MPTTLTSKGQVTIPKRIRDGLGLEPGCSIEFSVNAQGEVVLRRAATATRSGQGRRRARDRFDAVRGKADVKWRTDDLMALLRGED